ncbi:hypothetical protein MP228_005945 [Amoeboaphelidium protococcarum]|nr:hypothetical protein MP228_005945 [Amoeboaphelidium protococcarum]
MESPLKTAPNKRVKFLKDYINLPTSAYAASKLPLRATLSSTSQSYPAYDIDEARFNYTAAASGLFPDVRSVRYGRCLPKIGKSSSFPLHDLITSSQSTDPVAHANDHQVQQARIAAAKDMVSQSMDANQSNSQVASWQLTESEEYMTVLNLPFY